MTVEVMVNDLHLFILNKLTNKVTALCLVHGDGAILEDITPTKTKIFNHKIKLNINPKIPE